MKQDTNTTAAKAPAPPAPEKQEEDPTKNAVAEKAVKRPPFYVCDGKAVTTLRGIIADGDEIKADDLKGGKARLAELITSGYVAKG